MWRPPQISAVAMVADANDRRGSAHTGTVLLILGVLPQAIKLFGMDGSRF